MCCTWEIKKKNCTRFFFLFLPSPTHTHRHSILVGKSISSRVGLLRDDTLFLLLYLSYLILGSIKQLKGPLEKPLQVFKNLKRFFNFPILLKPLQVFKNLKSFFLFSDFF